MKELFTFIIIFVTNLTFGQELKDHYQIVFGKYKFYAHRLFNEKTDEVNQIGPVHDHIIINFPRRTDSVSFYTRDGDLRKDTLTTSYFTVDRIIDTISSRTFDSLVNSEIKLYINDKKLKIVRISITILFPDGTSDRNNFRSNKIKHDKQTMGQVKKRINNSYIVIDAIWFLDEKGVELKVKDDVAWKIKTSR